MAACFVCCSPPLLSARQKKKDQATYFKSLKVDGNLDEPDGRLPRQPINSYIRPRHLSPKIRQRKRVYFLYNDEGVYSVAIFMKNIKTVLHGINCLMGFGNNDFAGVILILMMIK